jgi:hypothetical protein
VREEGILLRGKGAKPAEQPPKGPTGTYEVTFDRPIAQCARVATPITLGLAPTVDSNDTNTVEVDTFTRAGVAANRPFSLQVAC